MHPFRFIIAAEPIQKRPHQQFEVGSDVTGEREPIPYQYPFCKGAEKSFF